MKNQLYIKTSWILTALLALIVALIGVIKPDIYFSVADNNVMAGVYSQDITTIIAALIIIFIAYHNGTDNLKRPVVILGLFGYLFYAYGIYSIERFYNSFYLLYLLIFALSFYIIIYTVVNLAKSVNHELELPESVRYVSVFFLFFIPLMFNFLWINHLLVLISNADKIEFLYSIYILDLCFIMPAFIIVGFKVIKKDALGLLLAPALFITGVTLLMPVGLGEIFKPLYNLPVDYGGLILYFALSILFLVLAVLHSRNLNI